MIDELMFAVKLEVVKRLVQPGKTLDVGCGDKIFTVHLPEPTGIDLYRECDHIYSRPDLWMDARDLKFPDGSFDNVTMFDALEHIPEADVVVREAARVLKSNGILAITDPSNVGLFWARIFTLRWRQAFWGRRSGAERREGESLGHVHQFTTGSLVELTKPYFRLEKIMHRLIFTGYRFRKLQN